jgi:ABC-2 type transport system permease protein
VIGLLRSELLRARSRRVVTMLVIAVLVAVTLGITIAIVTTNPPTQEEIDRGQRQYERELARCLVGNYGRPQEAGYETLEEMCAEYVQPQYYGPTTPRFSEVEEILMGTAFIVILIGAVIGATLGGADWSAGSMATLLAWEPRRLRVFAARAVAVAITALVVTIIAQVVFVAGLALFLVVRGTFDGTPDGFLRDLGTTALRISAVGAMFGLIGLSLATVGRSTVAGLGVLLGYLIIVEGFLSNLLFLVQKITFGRSAAVVVTDETLELVDGSAIPPVLYELTPGRAWVTLGVWAVALLVVAAATFRVRDVT